MALTPQQQFLFRGHPTSPGVRDWSGVSPLSDLPIPAPGTRLVEAPLTLLGTRPRYMYPWPRDMHADTANLGATPNGPKQPGIVYRGELQWAGFEPWNSLNEKLRRQIIAAAQSGQF